MSPASFQRRAVAALTLPLTAIAALAIPASPGIARSLPPGCDLGYGGQVIGTLAGRVHTFRFDGYNAVPPGHRAVGVRISWGDGTTSRGSAKTHTKPFAKGCYVTVFSGRHRYPALSCAKLPNGQPCTRSYDVRIRYRDATTDAAASMSKLRVIVVAPRR